MVVLGHPDDRFDHIWEAAATAATLVQRVIDFRRHDQGPGVLVEELRDRLFDLLFGDDVAVADQHGTLKRPSRRGSPFRQAVTRMHPLSVAIPDPKPGSFFWNRGHAASAADRRQLLLEHLVGRVEAVGAFEGDGVELERGDHALDRARLIDERVDRRLDGGIAGLVALGDLLVVGLAGERPRLDRLHLGHRGVKLAGQFAVESRVRFPDDRLQGRTFHDAAVEALVAAEIGGADADRVVEVRDVGVVGEAIMLLLGIVQEQAELHPLPGKFAIGERAHAGDDRGKAGIGLAVEQGRARLAVGPPVADHFFQVADQEVAGRLQIGGTPVAMAAGAVLGVVVGGGTLAGAGPGAVQVLTPEQKLDGVIAGRHIGLDAAGFLQLAGKQLRRDGRQVDGLAIDLDRRVGDDIGGVEAVLVRFGAIAGGDVVDQPFIERPGIDAAFPVIDDGVAEPVDLGLLIGDARRFPGVAGGLQSGRRGCCNQGVDSLVERLRGG